jgi:HK97 family phage prohead protease
MGTLQSVARDLQRSAPFRLIRAEGDDAESDGRTLTGYAAVFGQPTEIDSWEGQFTETIRKGAFRKSIRENTPVMQYDHGRHPLIGSIPIGRIEDLREDGEGLYTEARLSDNWLIQPVRDAIAEGSITGMSFRFEVVREEWRDKDGKLVKLEEILDLLWMPGDRGPLQRELIELKCRELGPVVFPAYAGTSVGMRARGLAAGIATDDKLTREIRQSLARDMAAPQVPEDPELRREVATALLFNREDAPPESGHPSPVDEPHDGAPPERGHPPQHNDNDAPPSDGHPSTPENASSERIRGDIREIRALMRNALTPIEAKDNN